MICREGRWLSIWYQRLAATFYSHNSWSWNTLFTWLFFPSQMYNVFPWLMERLPGRHHKVFARIEELKKFIVKKIQEHQDTLDSSSPRDYIDCFLTRLSQVLTRIYVTWKFVSFTVDMLTHYTYLFTDAKCTYSLCTVPRVHLNILNCDPAAGCIVKSVKWLLFRFFRKSTFPQPSSTTTTWCRRCWICTWQEPKPPAQLSDLH